MADQPSKRQVKNPETFRERALKASEEGDQPKTSRFKRTTKPVFGPLGAALSLIFRTKPFRLLGRILIPRYIRNSWRELKLVTWPNRQLSFRLTFAVIVFAII